MTRRVHIDRLTLTLRGVTPADAQDAARGVGPALAGALRGPAEASAAPGERVLPAGARPQAVSAAVARAIAARLRGGDS